MTSSALLDPYRLPGLRPGRLRADEQTVMQHLLAVSWFRRLAWFLADRGIMRRRIEEAFKRRLRENGSVRSPAPSETDERNSTPSEARSATG